jgi:hypothetical protein
MIFCQKYLPVVFFTCLTSPEILCRAGELPKPPRKMEPINLKRIIGQYKRWFGFTKSAICTQRV